MSNPSMEVMRRSVEGHLTEIERMMEFDRGYQAGRWAMDAERRAIALKLRKLSERGHVWNTELAVALGLDTHANNARICDRIIHLIGGASNHGDMGDEDDGASGCCHGRDAGSVHGHKDAVPTADVAPVTTGSYRGVTIHIDEQTKLDAERMKAVCELRKLNSENFECKQFMGDLLSAIDQDWISKASMYDDATLNEYMRDRLIHLLGGDQSSGIDVLRESCKNGENCKAEASESVESSESVENCKSGHLRTCPESGDEVSESAPSASITDELRRKTAESQGLRHECSTYRDMLLIASDELGSIKKHLDEIAEVLDGRD